MWTFTTVIYQPLVLSHYHCMSCYNTKSDRIGFCSILTTSPFHLVYQPTKSIFHNYHSIKGVLCTFPNAFFSFLLLCHTSIEWCTVGYLVSTDTHNIMLYQLDEQYAISQYVNSSVQNLKHRLQSQQHPAGYQSERPYHARMHLSLISHLSTVCTWRIKLVSVSTKE